MLLTKTTITAATLRLAIQTKSRIDAYDCLVRASPEEICGEDFDEYFRKTQFARAEVVTCARELARALLAEHTREEDL